MPARNPAHKDVRALRRGIMILEALAEHGWAKPVDLAKSTGIDRSSVYRIAGTLEQLNLVIRRQEDGAFALSQKIRSIAAGVRTDELIIEETGRILADLTREISWPSDLAIFSRGEVAIQASTHALSPITFHRATVGQTRSLLDTALGRAIMMVLTDDELDAAIDFAGRTYARNSKEPDRAAIAHMNTRYRETGYAWSVGSVDENVSAIAVGFRSKSGLVGAVNIVFFRRVLSPSQAAERYLEALRGCVEKIAVLDATTRRHLKWS